MHVGLQELDQSMSLLQVKSESINVTKVKVTVK